MNIQYRNRLEHCFQDFEGFIKLTSRHWVRKQQLTTGHEPGIRLHAVAV